MLKKKWACVYLRKEGRTTIPEEVRNALSIRESSLVECQLEKMSEKASTDIVEDASSDVSKFVGYAKLWNARRRAYRNRTWRFLKDEDKGLLNSAIEYLKLECRIVSATVIARLRVVMRKLGAVRSARFLMDGEIRAMEMRTQYRKKGVFKWVPQLKRWLNDVAYRFWLGTMQMSLEEFYPMVSPNLRGAKSYEK